MSRQWGSEVFTSSAENIFSQPIGKGPEDIPGMFAHQTKAVEFCAGHPRAALFMEMGTGKTRVIVELLSASQEYRPALVVAPLTLLDKWKEEVERWHPELRTQIIRSARDVKDDWCQGMDIFIINFEMLWRLAKSHIQHLKFNTMVIDESIKIKNHATKQSKACVVLGRMAKYRFILSGAPITNNPLDLWNQFNFLNPAIINMTWWGFKGRHAILGGYENKQVIGFRDLPQLGNKIKPYTFRVLKSECLDLPDKVYEVRYIEMTDEQTKVYKQMSRDLVAELSTGRIVSVEVAVARLVKLSEITGGFMYTGVENPLTKEREIYNFKVNPKLEALIDILEQRGPGKGTVVWARFIREAAIISDALAKKGIGHCVLNGEASQAQRTQMIEQFQSGKIDVMIAQPQVGGMGIDLTRADCCIFYSNDYRYGDRLQAEDRLHRIGQVNKVTYIDLVCKGTIDCIVQKALLKKKSLADVIMQFGVAQVVGGGE